MKTHLQTAHEYGVNEALKAAGYSSLAQVEKDAADLGLVPTPEKTAADVLTALKAKLGG